VRLNVGALFAGIGGLDLGLERAGHNVVFASEVDPVASAVLSHRFPHVDLMGDIASINKTPKIDLLTAGFPCQDISLAGTRLGLLGSRSGLVNHVFRLLELNKPEFVLMENVLNLLRLESGNVLRSILKDFEDLGYRWAYRVVDTRGFGLPQRRKRVVILATNGARDPGPILLSGASHPEIQDRILDLNPDSDYGFYWTEGKRGIGWAIDSVPTIKGGSSLGIPSPPAVFSMRRQLAGTIEIRDAERLQGFPAGWTDIPEASKIGDRWRLVGNAVSVPLSEWIASRLSEDRIDLNVEALPFKNSGPLPQAAFLSDGQWVAVDATSIVADSSSANLRNFLDYPLKPLSHKAISGYLKRTAEGNKKFPPGFLEALERQKLNSGTSTLQEFIL
jgi:DNA (cytosine-5)-methyltransferase 1